MLFRSSAYTDQLIATEYMPTVNGQVDYGYISRLSSDAGDGWVQAYSRAKNVILSPALVNKHLTPDEAREVIYSHEVFSNLSRQRDRLKAKYENVNFSTVDILSPQMKAYNFAEADEYQRLKEKIFTSELDNLTAKSQLYTDALNRGNQLVPLDRSSQSPLVN